jgi:hypothetical protein
MILAYFFGLGIRCATKKNTLTCPTGQYLAPGYLAEFTRST